MNVALQAAWCEEARADGATRQRMLVDALRDANAAVLRGEPPVWFVVMVAGSIEECQEHGRRMKRRLKEIAEDRQGPRFTACDVCGTEYPTRSLDRWHLVDGRQVCSGCKAAMELKVPEVQT